MAKPKTRRTCIVCDGYGPSLCRTCQRDYAGKATKADDGTVMATIRWAAERAGAKERERSKKFMDEAMKKWVVTDGHGDVQTLVVTEFGRKQINAAVLA